MEEINDSTSEKHSAKSEKSTTRRPSTFQSDKSVFFDKMLATNKSMMQLLRKYMVDNSQRDALNKFNFYLDAKQYLDTTESVKKPAVAVAIQK